MSDWLYSKKLIDRVLPEVKQWLGMFTAIEGSVYDDQNYNTDLIVPRRRIALRGRWVISDKGQPAFERYWHEFTIRTWRPATGHPTEYHKILAGHGDWFFYYWVDNSSERLVCATLIDLHALRPHLKSLPFADPPNDNPSGRGPDSEFRAYRIETAANRCKAVIAHVYADESLLTHWWRKQIVHLTRIYLETPPGPTREISAALVNLRRPAQIAEARELARQLRAAKSKRRWAAKERDLLQELCDVLGVRDKEGR
jgi:hypothetical protein